MPKTIVITGSTSGLGKATASACVDFGCNVVISSESDSDLHDTIANFRDNPRVAGIICDVRDKEQIQKLVQFSLDRFGSIDCWINNAGTTAPSGNTSEVPINFGEMVIQTNLIGTYYGSIFALRKFKQQGYGRLINITGRGEKSPQASANLYSSAKAWFRNFTLAVAKEEKGSAIEVGTFNPGLILTGLTNHPRILRGREDKTLKSLKMVMPIIGNSAEYAGAKLAELATTENTIKTENQACKFLPMVLFRLITGRRAQIDLSNLEPIVVDPEAG